LLLLLGGIGQAIVQAWMNSIRPVAAPGAALAMA